MLAEVAKQNDTPLVLMHMLGDPKTMQISPVYHDLVGEVREFLEDAIRRCERQGIAKSKLIIDPGIGFGKTITHNLMLIGRLQALQQLDVPILIGTSRKAFIRKILKGVNVDDIPADLPLVESGTQASVAASILNGAHIVRVHDVASTVPTVKMVDAILGAQEQ
jgi:dihydropteroate synthase